MLPAPLHKKCFLYLCIYLITDTGSLRVHMKHVGIDVNTELTICMWPACDRYMEVEISWFSIFCINDMKAFKVGLVSPMGIPR